MLDDAAQAFGAIYRGRKLGSLAAATATSFFPAKPLGCYGDGGAVFTDDDALAARIKSIRLHGEGVDRSEAARIGITGRLDTIQAAVLIEKLKIFPEEIEARNRIAGRYSDALADLAIVPRIANRIDLGLGAVHDPAQAARRDALAAALKAEGIPTAIYYTKPLHRQPAYRDFPLADGGVPISERLCREVDQPADARLSRACRFKIGSSRPCVAHWRADARLFHASGNPAEIPITPRVRRTISANDPPMIGKILTVGGYTLLSRLTGFFRDIMLAAIIGAGPVADAFFVAFRLPNHFRAIFAEGAFNAAFIPAYARIRTQGGPEAANQFGDQIFTLLFGSQVVLLALALLFTPQVIELLAPGFSREPQQFALAVSLTRITFPYLPLITLVTLWGGILNALHRFAAAAAAPILLNLAMMATLAVAYWFPSAGYAAAWGVLISGFLQAVMVGGAAFLCRRHDLVPRAPLGQRRAVFLQGASARNGRIGGHAARVVCRHDHCQLFVGRCDLGSVLR